MDVISSLELFKLSSDNFKLIDVGLDKLSGTPPIMSNKSIAYHVLSTFY